VFVRLSGGFGALSPHLKIPFPRSGLSAKFDRDLHPEFGIVGGRCSYSGRFDAAILSRIHSEVTSRSNWAKDRTMIERARQRLAAMPRTP